MSVRKRMIIFDMDGTLVESKQPASEEMIRLIEKLLDHKMMCIISGGELPRFYADMVDRLKVSDEKRAKIHLMPTCGTAYYVFKSDWELVYKEELSPDVIEKIIKVADAAVDESGLRPEKTWGDIIENRGNSQVTVSMLGQKAPLQEKLNWDPDHVKKVRIRDMIAKELPDLDVKTGGTTSIDITKPGINKSYGINRLLEINGLQKEEVLFIGDAIYEGGNDYPALEMGLDYIKVRDPEETASIISTINLL